MSRFIRDDDKWLTVYVTPNSPPVIDCTFKKPMIDLIAQKYLRSRQCPIGAIYPSPGFTSECYRHPFVGFIPYALLFNLVGLKAATSTHLSKCKTIKRAESKFAFSSFPFFSYIMFKILPTLAFQPIRWTSPESSPFVWYSLLQARSCTFSWEMD